MNGVVPTYAPTAVSWAPGRLDYFVIGADSAAYHKYWDGSGDWQPVGKYHERLEGNFTSGLAAASWGEGRIDMIGKGKDDEYYHLYLEGGSWQPDIEDWEDFGRLSPDLYPGTSTDEIQEATSAPSQLLCRGVRTDWTSSASPQMAHWHISIGTVTRGSQTSTNGRISGADPLLGSPSLLPWGPTVSICGSSHRTVFSFTSIVSHSSFLPD